MNNVIGLLVCMWLKGWKHVGSNLGLKEMDPPLYFYVLLSDENDEKPRNYRNSLGNQRGVS